MRGAILNGGAGRPIGLELLTWLREFGVKGLRQDIPVGCPDDHLAKLVGEVSAAGMLGVFIVAGWMKWGEGNYREEKISLETVIDESERVAEAVKEFDALETSWLELGNEPDLTAGYDKDPERFATAVTQGVVHGRSVAPGARFIMGGVSNLNRRGGFRYLERVVKAGLPKQLIIGVHPYRSDVRPWEKFGGWKGGLEQAAQALSEVVAGRPVAVSELGWHTATQEKRFLWKKRTWAWTDEEIAEFFRWETEFWMGRRADPFVWYQLNDGPNDEALHRFGVRYMDDKPKPVLFEFGRIGFV